MKTGRVMGWEREIICSTVQWELHVHVRSVSLCSKTMLRHAQETGLLRHPRIGCGSTGSVVLYACGFSCI